MNTNSILWLEFIVASGGSIRISYLHVGATLVFDRLALRTQLLCMPSSHQLPTYTYQSEWHDPKRQL